MNLRYTRHQVPRGTRPDAETQDRLYLFKKVPVLHATYQVRLLAFRAQQEERELVIRVPREFRPGNSLLNLMAELPDVICIEKDNR